MHCKLLSQTNKFIVVTVLSLTLTALLKHKFKIKNKKLSTRKKNNYFYYFANLKTIN
jgi:hypothetical protein